MSDILSKQCEIYWLIQYILKVVQIFLRNTNIELKIFKLRESGMNMIPHDRGTSQSGTGNIHVLRV